MQQGGKGSGLALMQLESFGLVGELWHCPKIRYRAKTDCALPIPYHGAAEARLSFLSHIA
jgi:hypothetical protein